MSAFPGDLIRAIGSDYAICAGPDGLASISVELAPFEFGGIIHRTSLRCDAIDLDLSDFSALAGHVFAFPINPDPGYIDASMLLFGVHVFAFPATLAFGTMGEETIPLRIGATLGFADSGMPQYRDAVIAVETQLHLPLTPERVADLAARAIMSADARSSHDIGRVMALLASEPAARHRMADLNVEVRRQIVAGAGDLAR